MVANRSFGTGERVLQYEGQLITADEALLREKEYAEKRKGSYLYFLTFQGKSMWSVFKLCLSI